MPLQLEPESFPSIDLFDMEEGLFSESGLLEVPDFRVVFFYDALNWPQEMRPLLGEVYALYLYDQNRHVYCDSILPQYECHFIKVHSCDKGHCSGCLIPCMKPLREQVRYIPTFHTAGERTMPIGRRWSSPEEYEAEKSMYNGYDGLMAFILQELRAGF